jgi:hypothetical protein
VPTKRNGQGNQYNDRNPQTTTYCHKYKEEKMTEVEAILLGATIGGAVAIGATVIAYCLNRSATLETIKITEFNKAAAEFRVAFLPEIIYLKHNAKITEAGSSTDLSEFLKYGYIHRHLKALETFKTYLSPQERTDIDKAWKEYCYNKDDPELLFFEQYFTGGVPKSEKETKQALALERIERILEFAKHK